MTWPATLPGAAVRVLRVAAGRRALRLALVVGGLFAIGLLCGERAYAADGLSVGSSVGSVESAGASAATGATEGAERTEGVVEGLLSPRTKPATQAKPATPVEHAPTPVKPTTPVEPAKPVKPGVRDESGVPSVEATVPQGSDRRHPVADDREPRHPQPLTPVGAQVVRPVGDVVRTVTQGLAEGLADVRAKVPPLAVLPVLPAAPESPSWPGWPGFELPALPDVPDLPGAGLPVLPGNTLPAPVTGTPQPGSDTPGASDGPAAKGRTGKEIPLGYGPHLGADVAVAHAPAVAVGHGMGPSGHAPVHQAPADHPGGVLGSHAAGDSGSPRHGDAQAVSLSRRVALGLTPGAAVRVEADEIKDRHRDIPVSPA
ncbi:hypothetical protein [Streptomyces lanatus]|uniref:Secreted protein n=1 Tax=Streptomyces lanatus TaxID=66900 RepID=A0ABV1XUX1_9ACTN|nr:hypothetical protein [Streptomyces lanatus]GHH13291.1 hypothetical protein GCM10018780_52840 [Streptomyces lanatus]